jgi:hypothetical protein
MKRVNAFSLVIVGGILMSMTHCSLGRPSYAEAQAELEALIRPALEAVREAVSAEPERQESNAACNEPVLGPTNGLRPELQYSLADVGDLTSEEFLDQVESAWTEMGLEVERSENERSRILFSGKDGYSVRALFQLANQAVEIGGSGPCVDDPNG